MARPTKKEQLKRKQLLKYFKRDSEIYMDFEKNTEKMDNERLIYVFIDMCSMRSTCNNIGGICCTFNNGANDFDNPLYHELMAIDEVVHDYYASILAKSQSLILNKHKADYMAYQMIDEVVLIELFGEERVKDFDNRGYSHYLKPLLRSLTDTEQLALKERVACNPFGTKTIIQREYAQRMTLRTLNTNDILVEIDFTKPIEEIQKYIKNLHDEYRKNNILNVYESLKIKRKYQALDNHDIYKTNGHKPFNIVLADKLFIYDAYKNGLNNVDIQTQLNTYTNDVKKISNDKISMKTIQEYLKFMINFIDNNGFSEFRKGYSSY